MKIHISVPLFNLAIFFSFIEISSQYNTDSLGEQYVDLPIDMGLWYNISNNGKVDINNKENQKTLGLLDGDLMVCVLEVLKNGVKMVRALMKGDERVKVEFNNYDVYDDDDASLYQLDFDKELPKKNQ
ncbi:uncharacterized protein LOC117172861 [Belonocnema kinseyi]|uniref:uncharacterized protein LOC117172861 n=1 Tax=Belonocnema kinseyi TaxID=2817044 RepID=UPI00143DE644|nr:uncharacterized protein LOC117172861 [Belonocnema kinseyi]